MQLLQMQVVSPRQFLQNCNLPFADKLLQQIESEEAQQAAMQQMMAEQQQLAQQGQQADPQRVQQAQQMLRNPNVAPS
jgi:anti-sigma factor ChrR (cupin superfamily)